VDLQYNTITLIRTKNPFKLLLIPNTIYLIYSLFIDWIELLKKRKVFEKHIKANISVKWHYGINMFILF